MINGALFRENRRQLLINSVASNAINNTTPAVLVHIASAQKRMVAIKKPGLFASLNF